MSAPKPPPSPERWQRLDALLQRAFELPGDRVSELLDRECGSDLDLRREIEDLLRSDREAHGDFLDPPDPLSVLSPDAEGLSAERLSAERLSAERLSIGPYRLVEALEHGGMAELFLARPADDSADADLVVIKTLPTLFGSRRWAKRFRREQEILAELRHPRIVPILDGGTTELGQPYFVMPYVQGRHVDDHCRARALGLEDRLELVRRICEAVHFAHSRSVIHRDLKPSNILVDARGEPRLLDFGIAKILAEEEAVEDPTSTGRRLMTPRYASPEQLRREPATPRSDLFSLGVILYELITGLRPFGSSSSVLEIARRVCEEDPLPPSRAVLAEGAEPALRAELERLDPRRVRNLDAAVLRALAKSPDDRPRDGLELIADLDPDGPDPETRRQDSEPRAPWWRRLLP